MPKSFNSSFTMFVYLRGHHVLEYYFAADTRMAANDTRMAPNSTEGEGWRGPNLISPRDRIWASENRWGD